MEELVALLLLVIVLLVCVYRSSQSSQSEGFETQEERIALSACPSDMKTFYLPDGRTACCNGPVIGTRCTGEIQCTMTGDGTTGLPNCGTLLQKDYQSKSNAMCPPSMSSYFEDKARQKKGCTSGGLDADRSKPVTATQPTCWIYPTLEENLSKKDSCELHRQMEEIPCFGTQCIKRIEASTPPLVTVQFVDKSGMYRTAYTRKSLEYYLNQTRPAWRDEGLDLDKNIMVAEVAKAYYVDKTLTSKDIQA